MAHGTVMVGTKQLVAKNFGLFHPYTISEHTHKKGGLE